MTNLKPSKDIKFYDASAIIKAGPKLLKEDKIIFCEEDLNYLFATNDISFLTLIKKTWGLHWLRKFMKKRESLCICGDMKSVEAAKYANDRMFIDEVIYVTADKKLAETANKYFGNQMIELI